MRISFDSTLSEDLNDGTHDADAYGTVTWINVTTGITIQEVSDKAGTTVASYDVSGAAAEMSAVTKIQVFLVPLPQSRQQVVPPWRVYLSM